MRLAIISDVHGNLTALEAVVSDLKQQKPDLVFHGGDLATAGCNPAEVIDCIQHAGWAGVLGNVRRSGSMRIAIISDVHGNLTALESVMADLRQQKPDIIFHGGDLATAGCNPAEVIDLIADAGWPGVLGNTDEMLWEDSGIRAIEASCA